MCFVSLSLFCFFLGKQSCMCLSHLVLMLGEGGRVSYQWFHFLDLGVASFQREANGGLALTVEDALEYKDIFMAQRKELSFQLIVFYLQCMATVL